MKHGISTTLGHISVKDTLDTASYFLAKSLEDFEAVHIMLVFAHKGNQHHKKNFYVKANYPIMEQVNDYLVKVSTQRIDRLIGDNAKP